MADTAPTSDLSGWTATVFDAAGMSYDIFEKGAGPGVLLIPEFPGITPEVLGLAQHLVDEGFTVTIPSPFGTPGRPVSAGYAAGVAARLCISREIRAFAVNAARPLTEFLRAVARDLAGRTPGRGVAVIGMCFTGNFALALAVDDAVLAPVMSQPAIPGPIGREHRRSPGVSAGELDRVAERTDDGLCVLGLRFSRDSSVPAERFATLTARLGDAFEVIELDSSPGNAAGFSRSAHSVLTGEVREYDGHPAYEARRRVVRFIRERLSTNP
ncbi:dienelactone hydrolase family protein [Spelaeicoccus albus]|uniref:Dienelactone hydrolase n=1 Tax=Spelaeicoccus albus TaxID=1280376 RepID=A0A7Z0IIZ8_9MICO|nr:dienelactone hydrolase family protein [Spelaeicoccus albus]NYI68887.1 dienelactone hydrolase [Spelaeicoccus albus]